MQEKRTYKIGYNHAFQIALNSATTCFNVQEQNIEDFDLPPETHRSLYPSEANSTVFNGFSKSSISRRHIKCTTKASLWSWGESVLITITSISSTQTEISVESLPSAQLFDWGKSKDNIDNFFNIIEQNIG